jgi:hypothetical protein
MGQLNELVLENVVVNVLLIFLDGHEDIAITLMLLQKRLLNEI